MITAICVTTAKRAWSVPLAVEAFKAQTYHALGRAELLVFSSGDEVLRVPEAGLGENVRHVHLAGWQGTLGEKRNLATSMAVSRGADVLVCWDDDDYHHPRRLETLVSGLTAGSRVVGSASLVFADLRSNERWLYRYIGSRPYLVGGSLAFYASDWRAVGGYPHLDHAEDTRFAHRVCRLDRDRVTDLAALGMYSLYVPTRHGANTGRITMREPKWSKWERPLDAEVESGLEKLRAARYGAG